MSKTAIDLIQERLGVTIGQNDNPEVSQATTSLAVLFKQNPNRVASLVVNLSSNVVFVSPSRDASSSKGIRLGPNGGSVSMNITDDFTLPAMEWTVISDTGTNAIYSFELVTQ